MSRTENREEMVLEYLEYNVPQSHRQEVRSLAEQVNRRKLSRRGFLSRASKLGIELSAGSTILTALTAATPTEVSAATTKGAASEKIADKYKNLTIGIPVFAYVDENQLTIANQIQAASQAAGLNWKLLLQDVAGDPGRAQQIFDVFITQGVNVIIDLVTPPRLVAAQMAKAREKKIPVFGIYTFGTNYPDMVLDYGGVTSVESSFVSSYMLFDQRIRHPGKKKIKLGIIDSEVDVIKPRRGVLDGLLSLQVNNDFEVVQVIPDIDPANTVQVATQATQAILTKNPDVDCLWVSWSPAPVPVATAVEQSGKGDSCKVYGLVAQSAGIQLIKEGKSPLVATSWVDLVWVGWGCTDLVLHYLSGKPVDRLALLTTNIVPCACINQAEANSPNVQMVDVLGGKQILTWMFGAGKYRDTFVEGWNEKYSS
jgi:ABC-type sugar transport system substrate-binding protein